MHGLWEEGIRLHCSERGGHVVSDGNNEYGVIIHYAQSHTCQSYFTLYGIGSITCMGYGRRALGYIAVKGVDMLSLMGMMNME